MPVDENDGIYTQNISNVQIQQFKNQNSSPRFSNSQNNDKSLTIKTA